MEQGTNRKTQSISRRDFLKRSAFGPVAAYISLPTIISNRVFGDNAPSNRITIGCIGLGIKGIENLRAFMVESGTQVVAICDVDAEHLEQARTEAALDNKSAYTDFRELLARDDIDAVVICTPDHWHVPIAVAAAKAGKDMYCEKPLTLTISQGRMLCNTVKRYNRILQTGSQQRSDARFRFACELVRNGRIGKLEKVEVNIPGNNRQCPPTWQVEPVPEGFDYDMWLGPAAWAPYTEQRCHYQYKFIFDYSGGQITNWGAHYLDIAQWGNGSDCIGPVEISGQGIFPEDGLFNTALNYDIEYTYANGVKLTCKTGGQGAKFIGSEGWVFVNREKIEAQPKSILTSNIGPDEIHLYRSNNHFRNFLDCVRNRKDPVASVEIGHRSVSLSHLGNIAILLGQKLHWNPETESFINNTTANRYLLRPMRAPWRL